MNLKQTYLAAGLAGLGAVVAFAAPASAADQSKPPADPTVRIAKAAALQDGGVNAAVAVDVTCPAGMQDHLTATLTQKIGTFEVLTATGELDFVCQGGAQRVTVPVAGTPYALFRAGKADATAHGEFYDASVGYFVVNDQRMVTLS